MNEPTFTQAERRSLLMPILLAVLALAVIAGLAVRFYGPTEVTVAHVKTDVVPIRSEYKAQSIVLGQNEIVHTLFVAATVRIQNPMRMPVYVDNFSLTIKDPTDAELTEKGVQKGDLGDLKTTYPSLKPLLAHPLLRETQIDPGQAAEGTMLFSFNVPESVWTGRKSAVLTIEMYHGKSVSLTIPKARR